MNGQEFANPGEALIAAVMIGRLVGQEERYRNPIDTGFYCFNDYDGAKWLLKRIYVHYEWIRVDVPTLEELLDEEERIDRIHRIANSGR